MKYILVIGGVISGLGKGIVTSSIGALLKASNVRVTAIKIDPYINIDAGTFSPYEHGEVFVLNDGCEVDLDLGNYERYLDTELQQKNNITTGKIYQQVINEERQGRFLGKTVQIVPHITDAIQDWIVSAAKGSDEENEPEVCIIELGGTVGDIEGMPFIEALRQLQLKVKRENFSTILVSLLPSLEPTLDLKTKPTQTSVIGMRSLGLCPDMIVCRGVRHIDDAIRDKISIFCGVETNHIFSLPNLKTVYQVPLELEKQGMLRAITHCVKIDTSPCHGLARWSQLSDCAINSTKIIVIAIVGKYTVSSDCYTSIIKAFEHACFDRGARPKIVFIDSSHLEEPDNKAWNDLKAAHCLLVPGGFGIRGIEGFQLAVVEYARNVLNIEDAHSSEFAEDVESFEPIVIEMLEYLDPDKKMGGTMRLGLRETKFVVEKSMVKDLYGNQEIIKERHRHRYEINPVHIERLESAGLGFVGRNVEGNRMQILELDIKIHPYFVGVQFHPEYKSHPFKPSPPFKGLIGAALKRMDSISCV